MKNKLIDAFRRSGVKYPEDITELVNEENYFKAIGCLTEGKDINEVLRKMMLNDIIPTKPIELTTNDYPKIFICNENRYGSLSAFKTYGFKVSQLSNGDNDLGSSYDSGNMELEVKSITRGKTEEDEKNAAIRVITAHIVEALMESKLYDGFNESEYSLTFGEGPEDRWSKETVAHIVETLMESKLYDGFKESEYSLTFGEGPEDRWFKETVAHLLKEWNLPYDVTSVEWLNTISNVIEEEVESDDILILYSDEHILSKDKSISRLIWDNHIQYVIKDGDVERSLYSNLFGQSDKKVICRLDRLAQYMIGIPSEKISKIGRH